MIIDKINIGIYTREGIKDKKVLLKLIQEYVEMLLRPQAVSVAVLDAGVRFTNLRKKE